MTYGHYVQVLCEETLQRALACARGSYQRNILLGFEALSGATLRGKARNYSLRYQASAQALLRRCQQAGLFVSERRDPTTGRRILVVGRRVVCRRPLDQRLITRRATYSVKD